MDKALAHRSCVGWLGCALAIFAFAAACEESPSEGNELDEMEVGKGPKPPKDETPEARDDRVCSECNAFDPGGETSDFGSQPACVLAYESREVTVAEGEDLGFALEAYTEFAEQPIDAEMIWEAQASEGGGPATGYEPETSVEGTIEVVGYEYNWLPDDVCDGTTCTLPDGTQTEQAGCYDYVMVYARGSIRTEDGAVDATFPMQAVRLQYRDADDFSVSAAADLSEVRGSLRIEPEVPAPRIGHFGLSLGRSSSGARGALHVSVYPDWDNRGADAGELPRELSYYSPIEGRWGNWDEPEAVSDDE